MSRTWSPILAVMQLAFLLAGLMLFGTTPDLVVDGSSHDELTVAADTDTSAADSPHPVGTAEREREADATNALSWRAGTIDLGAAHRFAILHVAPQRPPPAAWLS